MKKKGKNIMLHFSKSKLKTLLKKMKYKTHHSSWRNLFNYGGGIVKKGNRLYRFRNNQHEFGDESGWVVDTSCILEDFDRWANSQDIHAQPIHEFFVG